MRKMIQLESESVYQPESAVAAAVVGIQDGSLWCAESYF
jgi:hypothetical protein